MHQTYMSLRALLSATIFSVVFMTFLMPANTQPVIQSKGSSLFIDSPGGRVTVNQLDLETKFIEIDMLIVALTAQVQSQSNKIASLYRRIDDQGSHISQLQSRNDELNDTLVMLQSKSTTLAAVLVNMKIKYHRY